VDSVAGSGGLIGTVVGNAGGFRGLFDVQDGECLMAAFATTRHVWAGLDSDAFAKRHRWMMDHRLHAFLSVATTAIPGVVRGLAASKKGRFGAVPRERSVSCRKRHLGFREVTRPAVGLAQKHSRLCDGAR
jgi:hypothetical protein